MSERPRNLLLPVDYSGLNAEPGSRQWIITQRSFLLACLSDIKNNREAGQAIYERIKEFGGWQHLIGLNKEPFESFEEFCESPNGLGLDRSEIERRLNAKELAQDESLLPTLTHAEAGKLGGRGKKARGLIPSFKDGSTSAARIVARLKRYRPDIAARLAAGEFKSARAAARAAGWEVGQSPLQALRSNWKKATSQEREIFRNEIEN